MISDFRKAEDWSRFHTAVRSSRVAVSALNDRPRGAASSSAWRRCHRRRGCVNGGNRGGGTRLLWCGRSSTIPRRVVGGSRQQ